MLENLVFTARELLMAVVLASIVYFFEVLFFSRRRKQKEGASTNARISALEDELNTLKSRLELLEAHPPIESALDKQSSTHAEALRLAREGFPPQEMADRLSISRSEAELISALQKAER